MLTHRKEAILKVVIGEYFNTAAPVPSQSIARQLRGSISPATIRNEMVELEGEGYIHRPHVSAGGIPLDKGYRYYVETLGDEPQLPERDRRATRQQLYAVRRDLDQWGRLATGVLSDMARNIAIATLPKVAQARIRRVELVSLQEFLALFVLVLKEARVKRRVLALGQALSQDELISLSNKLSTVFGGATRQEIASTEAELTPLERQVMQMATEVMLLEEEEQLEEPFVDGLRHLLHQPEFVSRHRIAVLLEALEDRRLVKSLLLKILSGEELRVIIGSENEEDAMHECTVVASRYGTPGALAGVLGVIGPTRMEYGRTIASVRYLSTLMGQLAGELAGATPSTS